MSAAPGADWPALHQAITACERCPRLVAWREEVARVKRRAFRDETYWGRPVTGFGDFAARLHIIGLAPGAHGANRTGRVFTGDSSGDFLFRALYRAGFANQPTSRHSEDGLALQDAYISAVCRCAPPDNRPAPAEIEACLPFLEREIDFLDHVQGVVVLGKIAFDQALKLYRRRGAAPPAWPFAHGALLPLGEGLPWLLASYHPSRQNTQTGRLTEAMFDEIWTQARGLLH